MGAALRDPCAARPLAGRSPLAALQDLLEELTELLLSVPPAVYTAAAVPASGSIGAHVRHTLDHVAAFASAAGTGNLSYDNRSRGTAVEHDPSAALREILRLQAALGRMHGIALETPVAVRALLSTRGDAVTGWSSVARELAFVVSHTIHHQAMIGVLLRVQGLGPAGDRFGYAPTTPG